MHVPPQTAESAASVPARAACLATSLEYVRTATAQLRYEVAALDLEEVTCMVSACARLGHLDQDLLDGVTDSLVGRLQQPSITGGPAAIGGIDSASPPRALASEAALSPVKRQPGGDESVKSGEPGPGPGSAYLKRDDPRLLASSETVGLLVKIIKVNQIAGPILGLLVQPVL